MKPINHKEFNDTLRQLEIPENSRILVAVSGGMDSVALLHLLVNAEIETGVAHVNFGLRSHESDQDELFIKGLAEHYGVKFYSKHFETRSFAEKERISIQMAARQLRYEWFKEIAATDKWDYIATAHHADDSIETFFINLLRGSGVRGLRGIPAKSGNVIRPLISYFRTDIEEYIKANRLEYREDSSNIKTDYLRNRIRHQLVPMLDEFQPAFRKIMAGNIDHLSHAETFLAKAIRQLKEKVISQEEAEIRVSIQSLYDSGHPGLLLHEILQDYGFSSSQVQQIQQSLDSQPGKMFFSDHYRLIKDRNHLIITELSKLGQFNGVYPVEQETYEILSPIHLQLQVYPKEKTFHPSADPNCAFLDFDTLAFPLKIRKWETGDRFKPLGMDGHMKVSDFFTANKFSIADKEQTWLLLDDNDQIVWIIGHRIADQNRIRKDTRMVYAIKWINF